MYDGGKSIPLFVIHLDVVFLTSLSFWEVGKLSKLCIAMEMWVLFLEVAVELMHQ